MQQNSIEYLTVLGSCIAFQFGLGFSFEFVDEKF